jgi:hypothetical protein
MEPMKATEPGPITIPPEIAAKCDAPNQFENFDRLFRTVIAAPKSAIDKAEVNWKRTRARKKRAKKVGAP